MGDMDRGSKPAVLVTGGAGYIGAHTAKALHEQGFFPVVYDDLSSGFREAVRWGEFVHGDIRDARALGETIEAHAIKAVIHFAGLIEVGRSVVRPDLFWDINVGGTMKQVQIPSGEGDFVNPNVANTGPAFHVHSGAGEDGVLHMHDLDPHVFTLGEFFRGWGVTIDANHIGRYAVGNGHTLTMTVKHGGVNGGQQPVVNTEFGDYVIQGAEFPEDGDIITITYT